MDEPQSMGVQGLTAHDLYAFPQRGISDGSGFPFSSIERIPQDGVANRSKVNSNLMRATRPGKEFEKRDPLEPL